MGKYIYVWWVCISQVNDVNQMIDIQERSNLLFQTVHKLKHRPNSDVDY